jgi:hypothetical protein
MGRRFIITEEEKKNILGLYEQSEVKGAEINDIVMGLLPNNFVKEINNVLTNSQELNKKVNQVYKEKLPTSNPLEYLQTKGVNPYIFIVPDNITGLGFATTGLGIKMGNTPLTLSLNLGTDPKEIPSSLKFSRLNMNIPLSK